MNKKFQKASDWGEGWEGKGFAILTGLFFATSGLSQNAYQEPMLPVDGGAVAGYFPTLVEVPLLRGPLNSRSLGYGSGLANGLGFGGGPHNDPSAAGPDLRMQTATGLFEYEESHPGFYQRNSDFFRPIDHFFGAFTPNDAVTVEVDSFDNTSISLDPRLGFITRSFSPDLATIKAGPLFFDLLWVGSGFLWSDYNGATRFGFRGRGPDSGDGATGYIDLGLRGLLRLTDTIYLSVAADLMYLPFENEVALNFGGGRNSGLYARMNYSETFGAWDFLLYDEFRGQPGINWWGPATDSNTDFAGRYFFGFLNPEPTNQFYSDTFALLSNKVGMSATRLLFDGQWRYMLAADHTDFWQGFSNSRHRRMEHVGTWLGYEGSVLPFAPRFLYDMYAFSGNGTSSLFHRFMMHLNGRVTENINWFAQVGYLMTVATKNDPNRFLWEVEFDHNLSKNTRHILRFGENFFNNDAFGEALTSRFVQWSIDQRFGPRLWLNGFVQLSDQETIQPGLRVRGRYAYGGRLRFQPLDFTDVVATVIHEKIDQALPLGDIDRWLYKLEITQQLSTRLTGQIFYQYEDRSASPNSFTEHLFGISARRYF